MRPDSLRSPRSLRAARRRVTSASPGMTLMEVVAAVALVGLLMGSALGVVRYTIVASNLVDNWSLAEKEGPTLLDLMGLPPMPDAQGLSAMPLIMAAAENGSTPSEFQGRPIFSQLDRNWGQADQKMLRKVPLAEMEKYVQEGQFPAGSMGPKVDALIQFFNATGNRGVICQLEDIEKAIAGEAGTEIIK